jgi:hypothetical protein
LQLPPELEPDEPDDDDPLDEDVLEELDPELDELAPLEPDVEFVPEPLVPAVLPDEVLPDRPLLDRNPLEVPAVVDEECEPSPPASSPNPPLEEPEPQALATATVRTTRPRVIPSRDFVPRIVAEPKARSARKRKSLAGSRAQGPRPA